MMGADPMYQWVFWAFKYINIAKAWNTELKPAKIGNQEEDEDWTLVSLGQKKKG